jgi:hypothetical protein
MMNDPVDHRGGDGLVAGDATETTTDSVADTEEVAITA